MKTYARLILPVSVATAILVFGLHFTTTGQSLTSSAVAIVSEARTVFATVFDYTNSNPIATRAVDGNGDPISFTTPLTFDFNGTGTVQTAEAYGLLLGNSSGAGAPVSDTNPLPVSGSVGITGTLPAFAATPTVTANAGTGNFGSNITQYLGATASGTNAIHVQPGTSTQWSTNLAQYLGATASATNAIHTQPGTGAQWAMGGANALPLIVCNESVPISTASSGNVELVALTGGQIVYVCGFDVTSQADVSVQFISGTGTACATGETNKTGTYPLIVAGGTGLRGIQRGGGVSTLFRGAAGEAVCIELSAGVQVDGLLTYAKF